ncbi:MAG: hypothetical protein GY708_07545 [Actinomycetia bacterium]|nr:hypothetical protein [Actinomycetes bacterium]
MKSLLSTGILICPLLLAGCLSFGEDEETTMPDPGQVDRCRAEMYLNPSLTLFPLGYKLEGSGIDDAIWFKFKTRASDPAEIFDTSIVDVTTFKKGFSFLYEMEGVPWWDVADKDFLGGQVALPNVRFMNVGMHETSEGYIVYIMWHET